MRFAPTTSGPAHPGTLLAGLLAWLDARSRDARILLRLEDVDPERCTPEHSDEMRAALDWLGLDWDELRVQSADRAAHEAALDRLASAGLLYPCTCSRAEVARAGFRAADGGFRYTGRCRERELPSGAWREVPEALRLRLPAGWIALRDESGLDLSQDPLEAMGDPVLRRRDGAIAYHLAVVVDDAAAGLARLCALTGRLDEARAWFAEARCVLEEQGARPLLAIVDLDEARMERKHDAAGQRPRADALLARAREAFASLGMNGWLRRAESL